MAVPVKCLSSLLRQHLLDFKEDTGDGLMSGYVDTAESFNTLMCSIRASGHSYSTRTARINTATKDDNTSSRFKFSLMCSPAIPFFGSPFTIEKTSSLQCSQGPKYYKKAGEQSMIDHANPKKKRFHVMDTKKLGCSVSMRVRCIKYFPDITLDEKSNWREKSKVITKLREAVVSSSPPLGVLRYYIEASRDDHTHSVDSSRLREEVKPTDSTEDTRLLCLVPVTSSIDEAGDASTVHKSLVDIQTAQAEVKQLDILVCGKCHVVFHFMEEFNEHKADATCLKPEFRANINESKPQVWAFLLWKANAARRGASTGDDASSWGLYKRWCKLPQAVRDAWVSAGRALQVCSALGAATIKQVQHSSLEQGKKLDEVFTYTDSVRADKASKPGHTTGRVGRPPLKRALPTTPAGDAAEPRAKTLRKVAADTEVKKPKATRSSSLRGLKPGDEEEDTNYIVEKILAKRFNPRIKQFEYLLKWEGYPQDQNTWEPVNHMAECENLVEDFERCLAKQKAKQAQQSGHKVVTKTVKLPAQPESSSRPVRSSKTKAMENVKSWCGSIGAKRTGSDSDSDSDEKQSEYFEYPTTKQEQKTPGLLKSLSLSRLPGRPRVLGAVNGDPKPTPVLVANSKGVIKVDSRQVSTLSSGVYIVSNQSGTVKLSGQDAHKTGAAKHTGVMRVQPAQPGAGTGSPCGPAPRVLGPRTPQPPRPRFVPRPPAVLRPPVRQAGVKSIETMLGSSPPSKPASKLSQLLNMPKTVKATQSLLGDKSVGAARKPRATLHEAMDMDFSEVASDDSDEVNTSYMGADKTPSPLGSPPPLTLCPETGKILGQAEGEPTPSPSPEPGTILPDMEVPEDEEVKQETEYVTITGDDGVIYQIATNGSSLVDGETMLMTEDGQQCVYVSSDHAGTSDELSLDSAVAEAVAQLGEELGANSQIVMRGGAGGQILMTTGEEGAEERAAQVVAHIVQDGDSGGMRRVVLLLPDGNFMMTEVDEQQYAALDLDK